MPKIRLEATQITSLPEFQQLQGLHPAFQGRKTQLAKREIEEAREVDVGKRNTEKKIQEHLDRLRSGFQSRAMQMVDNSIWQKKGTVDKKAWEKAELTFFKAVQRCLTKPADRMAFQRSELKTHQDKIAAADSIIIDDDMITPTLLRNLGLDELILSKGATLEEITTMKIAAKKEIRTMLEHLIPLLQDEEDEEHPPMYYRHMLITEGKNKGQLLGIQLNGKHHIFFKVEAYSAERRLYHVRESQEIEIPLLRQVTQELKRIDRLLANWNNIKGTDKIEEIKTDLLRHIDTFENVKKESKIKVKKQVETALQMHYKKSGQMNPGAMRANVNTAIESLEHRRVEIEGIRSYLGRDETKIIDLIASEEFNINSFLAKVETNFEKLRILNKGSPLTREERNKITNNLKNLLEDLESIQCEPNLSFAKKHIIYTEKLIAQLKGETENEQTASEDTRTMFVKLYLMVKLHRTFGQIQKVLKTISTNEKGFDVTQIAADLKAAYIQLRDSRIDQDIKTPEFTEPYIEVYKHLRELIEECENYLYSQQKENLQQTAKTVANRVAERIRGIPILAKTFQRLVHRATTTLQPYLPFPKEKEEVASNLKDTIKGFDWDAVRKPL